MTTAYRFFFCALLTGFLLAPAARAQGPAAGTPERAEWLKANGHYDLGNQLFKSKNYKGAIEKYKEAIAVYPNDATYHYNLALAFKHSGMGPDAVSAFKRANELNGGKDWKCWKALGNTQWRLGQYADAKASFESGLKLSPPARDAADMRSGVAACSARIAH